MWHNINRKEQNSECKQTTNYTVRSKTVRSNWRVTGKNFTWHQTAAGRYSRRSLEKNKITFSIRIWKLHLLISHRHYYWSGEPGLQTSPNTCKAVLLIIQNVLKRQNDSTLLFTTNFCDVRSSCRTITADHTLTEWQTRRNDRCRCALDHHKRRTFNLSRKHLLPLPACQQQLLFYPQSTE